VTGVVRKTVVDRRQELAARADILRAQWQSVRDDQLSRRTELDQAQADIAEIDAWLLANP
jgi:hypothetical protein